MPKHKGEICIYCQEKPSTKRGDHVPPKGLYRIVPRDIITVPACTDCNNGFSRDDDYFLNLACTWDAEASDDGRYVAIKRLPSVKNAINRQQTARYFNALKPIHVFSQLGLYLGLTFEMTLNDQPLERTINRCVRGLYYYITKSILPKDAGVVSFRWQKIQEIHANDEIPSALSNVIPSMPSRSIGNKKVFSFRWQIQKDEPFGSLWYIEVHHVGFVGFTLGKECIE